jgi:DNA-binding response OmpR family regulator
MSNKAVSRIAQQSRSDGSVSILLIGLLGAARAALRDILTAAQWDICEAATLKQALGMLEDRNVGVAICDAEIGEGVWQAVLSNLHDKATPASLIVTSRLADEHLWAEVLNVGGYDVLVQPFDRGEVLRVALMGWMAWRLKSQRPASGNLLLEAAS